MNGAYRCLRCRGLVKKKLCAGGGIPWCCGEQMSLVATWSDDLPDEFVEW